MLLLFSLATQTTDGSLIYNEKKLTILKKKVWEKVRVVKLQKHKQKLKINTLFKNLKKFNCFCIHFSVIYLKKKFRFITIIFTPADKRC